MGLNQGWTAKKREAPPNRLAWILAVNHGQAGGQIGTDHASRHIPELVKAQIRRESFRGCELDSPTAGTAVGASRQGAQG